ncbi:MAG TPA: tetratricopeptide repeat protein, partial [Cyclobacteriaceae bacterium]|nr:tetratricopeptide repeat protein [Cyclobacteriaceae bacterium]
MARKLRLPIEEGKALRALADFTLESSNPSVAALDSTRRILLQSKSLAERSNDSTALAWTNCLIGKMHFFKAYWIRGASKHLDSVRLRLEPAIRYGSGNGIKPLLSECYHYYSLSLRGESSNFQTIVNLKLDALFYNDSITQPALRARILNHLGSLYLNFGGGLKGKSIEYFERARVIAQGIGAADICTSILSDLSDYYMLHNRKKESLRYFNEAIGVARKAG